MRTKPLLSDAEFKKSYRSIVKALRDGRDFFEDIDVVFSFKEECQILSCKLNRKDVKIRDIESMIPRYYESASRNRRFLRLIKVAGKAITLLRNGESPSKLDVKTSVEVRHKYKQVVDLNALRIF